MHPAKAIDALEDPRRRKLVFRCWHRGTREADLLLGRYADAHIRSLSEEELSQLETLLDAPDPDLFSWISGAQRAPRNYNSSLLKSIRAFHLNFPAAEDVFRP